MWFANNVCRQHCAEESEEVRHAEGGQVRRVRRGRRLAGGGGATAGAGRRSGPSRGEGGGHQPGRGRDPGRRLRAAVGSDLAGVVAQLGEGVDRFALGEEVIGFTDNRTSHAELVLVEQQNLTPRPSGVSWEAAGSLYVAGTTAYSAVRAVSIGAGDTLIVSAAGGVGSIAVQLGRYAGARVIGLASTPNHDWLARHGVTPVSYGPGVYDRVRDASGGRVDAFVDTFGGGYVDLALELGVRPERIDTIIDFAAARRHGVKTDGNAAAASADVLAELAGLVDKGVIEIPIARVFPLAEVREAYRELARRHTRGKIVLSP